jgi:hypothetical protein
VDEVALVEAVASMDDPGKPQASSDHAPAGGKILRAFETTTPGVRKLV